MIRKAGAEIGTTSIEISQGADQTNLSTVVVYPQMGCLLELIFQRNP